MDVELQQGMDLRLAIRNMIMLGRINSSMHQYELPLYCVGAGHLVGTMGLISLLQRQGYTIIKCQDGAPLSYQFMLYMRSFTAMKESILRPYVPALHADNDGKDEKPPIRHVRVKY